tara:strand:+ start:3572 stop:4054 length:483 start_codon:yes stop_codon:yes gene_type:complete
MKLILSLIMISLFLFSCKENTTAEKKAEKDLTDLVEQNIDSTSAVIEKTIIPANQEGEIVIDGSTYIEYYPGGRKKIKFQGEQDENGERNGKWLYFSEEGLELSITNYSHGKKHGFTLVKYPNGNIHYTGEYNNDEMVDLWKTYSEQGLKINEKDYGSPK